MEKIKSVLSGHKKSEDATHDTHTSSPGAHHSGETHPIYDQMTGSSSTQPTAAGTSTSAGQTATTGLGQTEHRGTEGPLGGHSAVAGDTSRPGAGHMHEGMSEASIKSGVIGFGANEGQQHAALSTHHNPQANLDRNQVVGGGSVAAAPTTADTSEQPSTVKSALPLPGASTTDQPHSNVGNTGVPGNTAQGSTTRQPFDQNLRQESYTNDTDRSFPLAGGVAPKHDATTKHSTDHHTASTIPPTQHATSTHHPLTSEREPGTKEKDAGLRDGHGREGLAGAAAAATAVGAAAPLSQSHQGNVHDQGVDSREATHSNQPSAALSTGPANTTSHTTQGHHPEALAAATAAAAKSSSMSSPTHGQATGTHDSSLASASRQPGASAANTEPYDSRYTDPGRPPGGRKLSYRHVPGGYPSPTPDESKTFLFYRDQVVPEPGADGPIIDHAPSTRGLHHESHHSPESSKVTPVAAGTAGALAGGLAGSHAAHQGDTVGSGTTTAGPHQSDTLNKLDPRIDSDLDSSRNTQGVPLGHQGVDHTSNAPVTSGALPASGQHELRHTGSLEQPEPRSVGHSDEHHHGRDAAIAGGVGAGAAGLGYAATHHQHDTPSTTGGTLPQETSPYSSKELDPRVLGTKGNLAEQRFDPQAKSVHSSTPVVASASVPGHSRDPVASEKSTTGPHKSSLLNKLDPRVKNDSSTTTENTQTVGKQTEPKDHHARDAALVGGGAATAAGVHHSMQRNDTPGTGTAVLPNEQSTNTSSPLSGNTSTVPGQTSHTSAPLSSSTGSAHPASGSDPSTSGKKYEPYSGPLTTSGTPFYGTAGAPAPVEGRKSSPSHQPASTSEPISKSHDTPVAQHQDPQHHYGRDAALAGSGAATAGGLAYASQHDNKTATGPASNTAGPHSSNAANVVDPRVQPDASKQVHHNAGPTGAIGHTTTGPHQSDTLNRLDPKVDEKAGHKDQHHLGRDAAVLGGAGAAGYGAHEAANAYGDHRSTQPGAAMTEQRYDTTASGARAPNPVPAAGHYDYNNDHTSRNVGLGTGAALGAGALGGAAYAGSRHGDNTQQVPTSSAQPLGSSGHQAAVTQNYPTQGTIAPHNTHNDVRGASHAPHDSVQEPLDKDHSKRNAAVLGGAGVAAAGGAAYAHNQNSDLEREKARMEKEQQERLKKEQHDREKEQHKLDKEHAKQEKEAHKLEKEQHKHEKEQHKHDKAVIAAEKQEHKHEKEQEKEAHRLEKEREKEAARLEKEREKETGTPEKKHGILGFLHRDKSKKERTSADTSPRHSGEVRRSVDNKRHSRDYAAAGAGAAAAGTTAAAYDDSSDPTSPRWKGKNKLHKDPPPGHPAREALEHHELGAMSGKREHVGVDGPIGHADAISGVHETRHNTYGAEPLARALGDEHSRVIEPHTGLPMNVGKYGDGAGGTDGSATVHGVHQHGQGTGHGIGHGQGVEDRTVNWEGVKKADTPY